MIARHPVRLALALVASVLGPGNAVAGEPPTAVDCPLHAPGDAADRLVAWSVDRADGRMVWRPVRERTDRADLVLWLDATGLLTGDEATVRAATGDGPGPWRLACRFAGGGIVQRPLPACLSGVYSVARVEGLLAGADRRERVLREWAVGATPGAGRTCAEALPPEAPVHRPLAPGDDPGDGPVQMMPECPVSRIDAPGARLLDFALRSERNDRAAAPPPVETAPVPVDRTLAVGFGLDLRIAQAGIFGFAGRNPIASRLACRYDDGVTLLVPMRGVLTGVHALVSAATGAFVRVWAITLSPRDPATGPLSPSPPGTGQTPRRRTGGGPRPPRPRRPDGPEGRTSRPAPPPRRPWPCRPAW